MSKEHSIVIVSGPSGGHLFPAVAFSEDLCRQFPGYRRVLITSRKARGFAARKDFEIFDDIFFLPNFPSPSGFSLRAFGFLLQLPRAFFLTAGILSKLRPVLYVGFGSYVSFPAGVLCVRRKIPTLIHEQNLVPGKATLWLARRMDCVSVSFDDTLSSAPLVRREVIGLPLRSRLVEAARRKNSGPRTDKIFRILIVGGSQGAHSINRAAVETFSRFTAREKQETAVIHITGNEDFDWVCESYRQLNIQAQTYRFFDTMDELYGQADLAVTRAGANTLFELALFQIPAIVIPYPHAGAHQAANADFFLKRQAILSQDEAFLMQHPEWLYTQIQSLKKDPVRSGALASAIGRLAKPEASAGLVRIAAELIPKRKI